MDAERVAVMRRFLAAIISFLALSSGPVWAQVHGGGGVSTSSIVAAGGLPHVATNAILAAAANSTYSKGVWRDHYATGGASDGPLFFQPQTGTCAANSLVNDGGNCVDSTSGDGNSWKALHQNNVLNVREFGALGDNSTDDTAAIQAAIAAASLGIQTGQPARDYIVSPSGNYCFKTPGGVTATVTGLTIKFQGYPIWKSCGNTDTTILTLNGNRESVEGQGAIQGLNLPTTTTPALVLGSSCVECYVDPRITVQYGTHAITSAGADSRIWAKATQAYGSSVAQGTAGAFWLRNKFDQPYPTNAPPTAPYTLAAWAGTHAYTQNALVSIGTNAWILQETAASCTSGSVEPAVAAYGVTINDGTCTWQLAQPYTYAALELQSGSGPNFVDKLDATGSFTYSVWLNNNNGGSGPQQTTLRDINAGQPLSVGVFAHNGQALAIEGGSATNCVLAGCTGVDLATTWGQNAHIGGGFLAYGNPYDIFIGGGTGTVVSGASLHGSSSSCVYINSNVNDVDVITNDLTTGATWGACAASITVASGTSDRYNIIGNLVSGIAPVDGGTGTHKTILGNN